MGDLVHPTSPFFDSLVACVHRQAHPFLTKVVVELSDGRCRWVIDQGVVDIADSGPSVDASVAIDGENFLKP